MCWNVNLMQCINCISDHFELLKFEPLNNSNSLSRLFLNSVISALLGICLVLVSATYVFIQFLLDPSQLRTDTHFQGGSRFWHGFKIHQQNKCLGYFHLHFDFFPCIIITMKLGFQQHMEKTSLKCLLYNINIINYYPQIIKHNFSKECRAQQKMATFIISLST